MSRYGSRAELEASRPKIVATSGFEPCIPGGHAPAAPFVLTCPDCGTTHCRRHPCGCHDDDCETLDDAERDLGWKGYIHTTSRGTLR
jgi:hypothetical protein